MRGRIDATGSKPVPATDVARLTVDVEAEAIRLNDLETSTLRDEWVRVLRSPAPPQFSRDLLIRAIIYRYQERASGGLSKAVLRQLAPAVGTGAGVAPPVARRRTSTIKPGTRLVREWHGVTHNVLVLDHGVEWKGKVWQSLSAVAREITGAHWSGPRFFGLKQDDKEAQ